MLPRRRALQVLTGALVGTAGCLGGNDEPSTPGPTGTRRPSTTAPTTTDPDRTATDEDRTATDGDRTATDRESLDVPAWTPSWTLDVSEPHVLGLDPADGLLYATLSAEGGPSAVAAVDPAARSTVWRTGFEGEAVAGSYDGRNEGDDIWGVTLAGDAVYTVTGRADPAEWTALHALDRATGERRWSLRRERELAVRGVVDGTVFATGLEFFEPESSHDTPDSPLESVVYAIDAATGRVRWTRSVTGVSGVAVGAEALYVAARGRLLALGHDGSRRWRDSPGASTRALRVASGRVYHAVAAGDDRSTVRGLDRSGTVEWRRTLPVETVLLDERRLYAGGRAVLALGPDGSVAWRDDAYGGALLLGPAREKLYTRTGRRADAVGAYATATGRRRWTFDPPSRNAWPATATREAAVVQAITGDDASEPFYTLYAVDLADGTATAAFEHDSIFTVESLDGTVYVGDGASTITALDP